MLNRLNQKWFSKWVDSGQISFISGCQGDYAHITFMEPFYSSSNFFNTGLKKKLDKMWFLSTGSQKMCKAGM